MLEDPWTKACSDFSLLYAGLDQTRSLITLLWDYGLEQVMRNVVAVEKIGDEDMQTVLCKLVCEEPNIGQLVAKDVSYKDDCLCFG